MFYLHLRKSFLGLFIALLFILPLSTVIPAVVHADTLPAHSVVLADDSSGTSAGASSALRKAVFQDLEKNSYELAGGGSVRGKDVISADGVINNAIFGQLSSKAQGQFATDLVNTTKKYTDPSVPGYTPTLAKSNSVDESTASNWFQELRQHSSIGSQMLTAILKKGVYADITTGAKWFRPFSSPLSTLLGFLAIAIISLLGVRSIMDLSYISIPFFQTVYTQSGLTGEGSSGGNGSTKSFKIISTHAINAVKAGEENKNPIWYYFRKAAVEYLVLFLAILFLCFNYWWEFVGVIADGFMGVFGY